MLVLQYILGGALVALALGLVLLVLLQSGKDSNGLSGTISGGSTDTYYGQNKGRSRDKMLARLTVLVAILFVAALVTAYVLFARYC